MRVNKSSRVFWPTKYDWPLPHRNVVYGANSDWEANEQIIVKVLLIGPRYQVVSDIERQTICGLGVHEKHLGLPAIFAFLIMGALKFPKKLSCRVVQIDLKIQSF